MVGVEPLHRHPVATARGELFQHDLVFVRAGRVILGDEVMQRDG